MSTIKVTNLLGRNGSPTLPDGAVITGVATATTFDGSLKSTGTPTLGLGVTINSSGLHISGVTTVGVVTGGTYYGSGSNLTGVGESVAPWHYNPDINDSTVDTDTGIGITFNKKVVAGSGTATIKIVNAGAAGTTIQSWGVSSCSFDVTQFSLGSLVSHLTVNQTYQVDIPSGFILDSEGSSYVGTAYTFAVTPPINKVFAWGSNENGETGTGDVVHYSSPVQVPGTTWNLNGAASVTSRSKHNLMLRTDGTLWAMGLGSEGQLGLNDRTSQSSPKQVGSDTTWASYSCNYASSLAVKTDGTLWSWGDNVYGQLGINDFPGGTCSSPTQVPGTWKTTAQSTGGGYRSGFAINSSGELFALGGEWDYGKLGQNSKAIFSSPIQIHGGGNWSKISVTQQNAYGVRTNGTLWGWGRNNSGQLGQNAGTNAHRSSPVQVPGTTWSTVSSGYENVVALKTDGTMWIWGSNDGGALGQNSVVKYSSPVQIPGTTWSDARAGIDCVFAFKTDGSLWGWGDNSATNSNLGQNNLTQYSSPVQVGSDTKWNGLQCAGSTLASIEDYTP